jgi:hypothetical protein
LRTFRDGAQGPQPIGRRAVFGANRRAVVARLCIASIVILGLAAPAAAEPAWVLRSRHGAQRHPAGDVVVRTGARVPLGNPYAHGGWTQTLPDSCVIAGAGSAGPNASTRCGAEGGE